MTDVFRLPQQGHLGDLALLFQERLFWAVDIQTTAYFIAGFFKDIHESSSCLRFSWREFNVIAWDIYVVGWKIAFGYSAFRYTDNIKLGFKQADEQL